MAFHVSATPLAVSEVIQLLKNPPEDGISTLPPAKPQCKRYKSCKTTANAWCVKGLALTSSLYLSIRMGDEYLKGEEYMSAH